MDYVCLRDATNVNFRLRLAVVVLMSNTIVYYAKV